MKICLTTLCLALAVALPTKKADAYSRVHLPLNVAVAQAGAIVEARVTRAPETPSPAGDSAELNIKHVFKGSLEPGAFTVQLQPDHWWALGKLEVGKNYLLFLRRADADSPKLAIMFDGTRLHSDEDTELIQSAVELTPAWSRSDERFSTVLTAEKFRVKLEEELNLWVGYKNTSNETITLKYRDWPLETNTYWSLGIKSEAGAEIKAAPHPEITQDEIAAYFSKFPRSYEIVLEPQQETFLQLERINSAEPGWGHKERLRPRRIISSMVRF